MERSSAETVAPASGLRFRLPATMEDAQALLRITAVGNHVRSSYGREKETVIGIPAGGEQTYEQSHARVMQLMAETEARLGRSVLNDGKDVQLTHEQRLAFSARLKSLGLGIEVEDEAGARPMPREPQREIPYPSGVASPETWKNFAALWGVNLASNSGR